MPINPPVAPPAPAPASAAAIGPATTNPSPGIAITVPTAAIAANTAPTVPPIAPPTPNPSAACDRVCTANSLFFVESDIRTLMSSRVYPRLIIASTAASAAARVLKRPVTKVLDILSPPYDQGFGKTVSGESNRHRLCRLVTKRGLSGDETILRQRKRGVKRPPGYALAAEL